MFLNELWRRYYITKRLSGIIHTASYDNGKPILGYPILVNSIKVEYPTDAVYMLSRLSVRAICVLPHFHRKSSVDRRTALT